EDRGPGRRAAAAQGEGHHRHRPGRWRGEAGRLSADAEVDLRGDMAELWVVVDHDDGDVRKVTLQALAGGRRVAAELGLALAAVFIGSGFDRSRDGLAAAG